VCERERERESVCVRERDRVGERVGERKIVLCLPRCVWVGDRMRAHVCVYVYVKNVSWSVW